MIHKVIHQRTAALLETVQEGISYAGKTRSEVSKTVLESIQIALDEVEKVIQENHVAEPEFYAQKIVGIRQGVERGCLAGGLSHEQLQDLLGLTSAVRKKWEEEPTLLEIAFFPYKASMWDSMDSVWRAADADPTCDCYVVPIPYYDRNPDRSFGKFHYEGGQFPPDVPVVDYKSYDVAERKPDIVYIHNPYDEFNYVTSVDSHFYSHELKKHTGTLIYIPYYVAQEGKGLGSENTTRMLSAYRHADRIVVQSEPMRQGVIDAGVPEGHLLALGTPKLDYVINHPAKTCPASWAPRLKGRSVFLVNSSLGDFLGHNQAYSLRS